MLLYQRMGHQIAADYGQRVARPLEVPALLAGEAAPDDYQLAGWCPPHLRDRGRDSGVVGAGPGKGEESRVALRLRSFRGRHASAEPF